MDLSLASILVIAAIGLLGGSFGGLLGLGGSVFMIPALTFVFGPNHHLYQASALIINIVVAGAATRKHRGRGTIRADVVPAMATAASLAALMGVFTSNRLPTAGLSIAFGVFLCYAWLSELVSLARRKTDASEDPPESVRRPVIYMAGLLGGFASGLLGIGGGAIMVPILRKYARLPLRQAVACSAATMIVACIIGATAKNSSLAGIAEAQAKGVTLGASLTLAALLAPTAILGGTIGAMLVYRLPTRATRLLLAVFLGFAGSRMITTGLRALDTTTAADEAQPALPTPAGEPAAAGEPAQPTVP